MNHQTIIIIIITTLFLLSTTNIIHFIDFVYDTFEFLKLLPRSTELKWGGGEGGGVYGVYLPNHLSHYRSCLLPHYNIWLSIKKICHVSFLHRFQSKKIEMVYDFSFLKITKKCCVCASVAVFFALLILVYSNV